MELFCFMPFYVYIIQSQWGSKQNSCGELKKKYLFCVKIQNQILPMLRRPEEVRATLPY